MPRPPLSSSAILLLLVVGSLAIGLASAPLVKVGLEALIPGSELLAGMTRAELDPDDPQHGPFTWDFGKVSRRWLLVVVIAVFLVFRRKVAWGARAKEFLSGIPAWRRHLGLGVVAGLLVSLVYFGSLLHLELLTWRPLPVGALALWTLEYAAGAAAVALLEELFFRAVMLGTMVRDWGVARGVMASTAVFAVVHAISGSLRVPDGWDPGVPIDLLRTYYTSTDGGFGEDLRLMVGLALLGLMLSLLVLRTGSLWAAIGLHGMLVMSSRLGKQLTRPGAEYQDWLLGDRTFLVAGVVPMLILVVGVALVHFWPRPPRLDQEVPASRK